MILGTVIASVVGSDKDPAYVGKSLFWIQADAGFGDLEQAYLAVDTVQAGVGDRVLVFCEGTHAPKLLNQSEDVRSIRSWIVGIVDRIDPISVSGDSRAAA